MARSGPPAYAWDWFARQRLPWREVRHRLIVAAGPVASRYAAVDTRGDVIALLRADYAREDQVREVVHAVVGDVVFLGATSGRFADLGARTTPRGMRWWWTALTGEDLDPGRSVGPATPVAPPVAQLSLDDVNTGYGD